MMIKKNILLLCAGLVIAVCSLLFLPTKIKAAPDLSEAIFTQNSDGTWRAIVQLADGSYVDNKLTNDQYNAGINNLDSEGLPHTNPRPGTTIIPPGSFDAFERGANALKNTNKPGTGSKIINVFIWLISFLLYFVSVVVGLLLYISGLLLDFFFSADKLANSDIVKNGWTFTRDTLNFVFILVLLAISFSTIAGLETFQMRKALPSLIFAALLVNFSLAIGGAFLQVSNVMTDSIADSILGSKKGERSKVGEKLTKGLAKSGNVAQFYTYENVDWLKSILGEASILLPKKQSPINFDAAISLYWRDYLMLAFDSAIALVMICIFASAFIFLAILMAIRIVMLVILLILSPVPFVFSIVPQLKPYATKWWDNFIRYVIFLPAVTFFLALAIKIMSTKQPGKTTPLVFQFFEKAPTVIGTGVIGSIIDMVFVSIFIYASVLVAKTLGIAGANAAASVATRIGVGMPARAIGKGGLMATNAVGNKIAKTPYLGSGLRGARTVGRVAQRLYKGQESPDQLAEKQKALAGKSEDELRAAFGRGNIAAGVKLMENDDLKKEEYAGLSAKVPKSTEAYNKVQTAWKKKDPIGAIIKDPKIREKLKSGSTNLDKTTKDELQKAFTKMNKDDYAKLKGEDLEMAMNSGISMPMSKSQLNAVAESSNTELQTKASKLISTLEAREGKDLNPGEKTILAHARKIRMTTSKEKGATSGASKQTAQEKVTKIFNNM